jgi:hypothetical protein
MWNRLLLPCLMLCKALVVAGAMARAETPPPTRVLVDPAFAQVAVLLVRSYAGSSGHRMALTVTPDFRPETLDARAHLVLAPDTDSAEALEAAGLALPGGLDYARARVDDAESPPRRAVLTQTGRVDPGALGFLEYLSSPEAWDVIVHHGFGAH